ncbi:DMT family transporter [Croceiramulus getboli]|nr:DMT family transporter [Flavobacteriaceae bacterium YJPT1-3]
MESSFRSRFLSLNLAMLLISTSGVLGRYITLWPVVTIAYRALLALLVLSAYLWWKKASIRIEKKDLGMILLSGLLMGAHWVLYYEALRRSTVAIGMLTIFTYPALTALLEPLFLRSRLQWFHIGLALLVLVGVSLLVPEFSLEHEYTQAAGFGLLSALAYALRNIILKTKVRRYSGSLLMTTQLLVIALVLSPFLFAAEGTAVSNALPYLLILAILTTAVGHTLFVMSFKHFSITAASIMSSVQPVYGILLGVLFLGEVPPGRTLLGGLLIVVAVALEGIKSSRDST